jgi:DNA-binding NarL/FixJ family response regulator
MEQSYACASPQAFVIIIDQNKLRRASVINFLQAWAQAIESSLIGLCLSASAQDLELISKCRLAVLNLGGCSVNDPDARHLLETLRTTLPQVPVVLFSDVDDPVEVVAAFQAGIKGFVPASTEPELVLHALTFIMGGGSFFPPSVLLGLKQRSHAGIWDDAAVADEAVLNDGRSSASTNLHEGRLGQLTVRQLDVLALLRQGKSNKMIARDLGMREATVKVHVRQILRKLGATNRTQAALLVLQNPADAPPVAGVISTAAFSNCEIPGVEAEGTNLFTKGVAVGRSLLLGSLSATAALMQADILEMAAAAPAYVAFMG